MAKLMVSISLNLNTLVLGQPFQCPVMWGVGGIQLRSIFLKLAAFEVLRTNFGSEKVYFQKVST